MHLLGAEAVDAEAQGAVNLNVAVADEACGGLARVACAHAWGCTADELLDGGSRPSEGRRQPRAPGGAGASPDVCALAQNRLDASSQSDRESIRRMR